MSGPFKVGSKLCGSVSVDVFSSIEPSRVAVPCQEGLSLSVTTFGDDPDAPLAPTQMMDTALLGCIDRGLIEIGPGLGWVLTESGGRVEWEADQEDEATQRLVTDVSLEDWTTTRDDLPTPPQTLAELALVIRLNHKRLSPDAIEQIITADAGDDLPSGVPEAMSNVFGWVSDKLSGAFPNCFNQPWKRRLINEASFAPLTVGAAARALFATNNLAIAQAFAELQAKLLSTAVYAPDPVSSDAFNTAPLVRHLTPTMAVTARELLRPDRVRNLKRVKQPSTAAPHRKPASHQLADDEDASMAEIASVASSEEGSDGAGEGGWDHFGEEEDAPSGGGNDEGDGPVVELDWVGSDEDLGGWGDDEGGDEVVELESDDDPSELDRLAAQEHSPPAADADFDFDFAQDNSEADFSLGAAANGLQHLLV